MTSSSSKRHSILPPVSQAGPKAPVTFSSNITISDSAILSGVHQITISRESVIHPRAKLDSQGGTVNIGKRCIIHERTHIGAAPEGMTAHKPVDPDADGVSIESWSTVEAAAVIETGGTVIGEGSLIGVSSRIGAGATIGKYCTISPRTVVLAGERVPDYTVVYSNGMQRPDKRDVRGLRTRLVYRQLEVLRRLISSKPEKFKA